MITRVYIDGRIVPWPLAWHEGSYGWVDVWVDYSRETWLAFPTNGVIQRMQGNVTIVTVLAKTVWMP